MRLNLWRLSLAIGIFIHQNEYFGWNMKPKSDAELIADLITILAVLLAFTND